jgi:hypothetical protein
LLSRKSVLNVLMIQHVVNLAFQSGLLDLSNVTIERSFHSAFEVV